MGWTRRWRGAAVAVAAAALALVVQSALATPANKVTARGVTQVKVLQHVGHSQILATPLVWTDLPAGATTVNVPAGTQALLLLRFSASTTCAPAEGNPLGSCFVRILVDDVEAAPATGTGAAFDEGGAGDTAGAYSIERSFGPIGEGTHSVKVQWYTNGTDFIIFGGWHLTIERVLV